MYVLTDDDVRVEIECIGEGWSGDYDSDDPDDAPLLRFTVLHLVDETWQAVDDASYCTGVSDTEDQEREARMARIIMREVADAVRGNMSIKRLCEELSWAGVRWEV